MRTRLTTLSILMVVCLLFSSCTPTEINETITDIGDVVQRADTVIAILQASGAPAALRQKSQYISFVRFAEQADLAAWRAAAETNSKESLNEKNEKIDNLLKDIKRPDFSQVSNPSERGALESLASSIDLLRGRLQGNREAIKAKPEMGDVVPQAIPATITGKLQKIRAEASQGTAAAQALIDGVSPPASH